MFDPEQLAPDRIRRLSCAEYDRMAALGMFEDQRVELLRGVVVAMSPQGVPHRVVTAWFVNRLVRALDESYLVFSHTPFEASDDSEPEPDVSVTKHPVGAEAPACPVLVIEVSDSSLRKDRAIKTSIYAQAGCPEYWIVNISRSELVIEVHRDPQQGTYRTVEMLRAGDVLRAVAVPAVEIAIADIHWYPG